MSVATQATTGESAQPTRSARTLQSAKRRAVEAVNKLILAFIAGIDALGLTMLAEALEQIARSDRGEMPAMFGHGHDRGQMGAKRIGSLAIGIGVVGIVLNKMNGIGVVNNSNGVIDVSGIFGVAGDGLQLLVVGVIIAAAAVLLNLWSGF